MGSRHLPAPQLWSAQRAAVRHPRSRVRYVVYIDDDLQHPPETYPDIAGRVSQGFDVVYAPPQSEQHGFLRDLASWITKLALKSAMGANVARDVTAYRVFRTQLRGAFATYHGPHVSIDVLLTWATTRFTAVRVPHAVRKVGISNYTFRKLLTHALNMVTGFSTMPLQLAGMLGFTFTLFGMAVLAYVIGVFIVYGRAMPGFAFLASIIAIFSGAQMFALGVIGEYLARMHFRMMDRPTYAVRETTRSGRDPQENSRKQVETETVEA
jgi:undecaprenyl-phosphate 4-deoxy-4-formamido-L-arabinose transferase